MGTSMVELISTCTKTKVKFHFRKYPLTLVSIYDVFNKDNEVTLESALKVVAKDNTKRLIGHMTKREIVEAAVIVPNFDGEKFGTAARPFLKLLDQLGCTVPKHICCLDEYIGSARKLLKKIMSQNLTFVDGKGNIVMSMDEYNNRTEEYYKTDAMEWKKSPDGSLRLYKDLPLWIADEIEDEKMDEKKRDGDKNAEEEQEQEVEDGKVKDLPIDIPRGKPTVELFAAAVISKLFNFADICLMDDEGQRQKTNFDCLLSTFQPHVKCFYNVGNVHFKEMDPRPTTSFAGFVRERSLRSQEVRLLPMCSLTSMYSQTSFEEASTKVKELHGLLSFLAHQRVVMRHKVLTGQCEITSEPMYTREFDMRKIDMLGSMKVLDMYQTCAYMRDVAKILGGMVGRATTGNKNGIEGDYMLLKSGDYVVREKALNYTQYECLTAYLFDLIQAAFGLRYDVLSEDDARDLNLMLIFHGKPVESLLKRIDSYDHIKTPYDRYVVVDSILEEWIHLYESLSPEESEQAQEKNTEMYTYYKAGKTLKAFLFKMGIFSSLEN